MLKKGDMWLAAILLAAILLGYGGTALYRNWNGNNRKIAVIKQNDRILRKIDLDTVKVPERIKVTGDYDETILVEKGRIRFETADCPDKVCVKTGWISKMGDTAVCLPNRTIIKIEGEKNEVDGVAY